MKRTHLMLVAVFGLTFILSSAHSRADSIEVDPSGDFTVIYSGEDENGEVARRIKFVVGNKVSPLVTSKFRVLSDGRISYKYRVKNEKESLQNLEGFTINPTSSGERLETPQGWRGVSIINLSGAGRRLTWSYWLDDMAGLPAGKQQQGFGFVTTDLPGVGVAILRGTTPVAQGYPDSGPEDEAVYNRVLELLHPDDTGVKRLVVVPTITVVGPFNAISVLEQLRRHIDIDLTGLGLIDPVFAASLNRSLTAAIEAAKHNNDKGAKENLKDIRKALKKAHRDIETDDEDDHARKHRHGNKDDSDDWEHTDPKQKPKPAFIDKLAARVLDFDVKYVLGRLGKNRED